MEGIQMLELTPAESIGNNSQHAEDCRRYERGDAMSQNSTSTKHGVEDGDAAEETLPSMSANGNTSACSDAGTPADREAGMSATEEQIALLEPEVNAATTLERSSLNSSRTNLDGAISCNCRHTRYATTAYFGRWIPEVDPENARAKTFSRKLSKLRNMLLFQLGLASIAVLTIFPFTVWASVHQRQPNGVGTLLIGNCSRVTSLDTGIHAGLNMISTLFLGAGNYCLQVLVAPTKSEMRTAHSKGSHYDIGVHSMRNLWRIPKTRTMVWFVLCVISVTLHLLWNSCFFTSIPFVRYPTAVVTSDFLSSDDNWNWNLIVDAENATPDDRSSILALHSRAAGFTRLANDICIEQYVNPLTATGELVLVSSQKIDAQDKVSLLAGWISGNDGSRWEDASFWICAAYEGTPWKSQCDLDFALPFADNWHVLAGNTNVTIEYCLVGEQVDNSTRCGLHYSQPLLVIVCVCVFVDAGIIAGIAYAMNQSTLLRLGDALSELLENYDRRSNAPPDSDQLTPQQSRSSSRLGLRPWPVAKRARWFAAVSRLCWLVSSTVVMMIVLLGLALFLLTLITEKKKGLSVSLPSLARAGLGEVRFYALIGGPLVGDNGPWAFAGHVVFANVFQILVSFAYLFYNNIWTNQLIADELLRFLSERKPLRVTEPRNDLQRSSYFLSLPWKYALPQMILFGLLHWVISQSIFIAQTDAYSPGSQGVRSPTHDGSRLGYSSIGIMCALILGLFLLVAVVANSSRRYPEAPVDLPMMATNSAWLAALCQRPEEDADAHLYPVRLGVVKHGVPPNEGCEGRITFSTDYTIEPPVGGVMYECAVHNERPKTGRSWLEGASAAVAAILPSHRRAKTE